jgi:hypothetical protein
VLSGTGPWHKVDMTPAALVDPDTWVRAQSWFNPATFQLNRPEDAEIDPFDNSLYTSLTNNTDDPTVASAGWPRRAATPPPTPSPGPTSPSGALTRHRSRASSPPTTWCSAGSATSTAGGVYGDPTTYTSYWPHGNKITGENPSEPLPSVIAIRRS